MIDKRKFTSKRIMILLGVGFLIGFVERLLIKNRYLSNIIIIISVIIVAISIYFYFYIKDSKKSKNVSKQTMDTLNKIIVLMELYVNNKISAQTFKNKYFTIRRKMRDDNISFPETTEQILDKTFSDCDLYEKNISLRGKYTIDEAELSRYIKENLKNLKKLI
jgi:uncharacterized membrane protein